MAPARPTGWEMGYKRITDSILNPLLGSLTRAGIRPSGITHARLVIGLIGLTILVTGKPFIGACILLLALILDSLDGGLARYQKRFSDRGTFLDRAADYTIYSASVIAMHSLGEIGSVSAIYHIYIMFSAVILSIIAKNEQEPTDWIIKPNANLVWFMIAWYTSLFLWAIFDSHILDKTIFWINAGLTISAIESYITIYQRWSNPSAKKKKNSRIVLVRK